MLFHVSVEADDPRRVAEALAEIWGGEAFPFPPVGEGSWAALAGDDRGSMIEIYPRGTELHRGIDGAVGRPGEPRRHSAVHMAIATKLAKEAVFAIADRHGWPATYCVRGGRFGLIEMWVEGCLMIEVLTPAMQQEYLETLTIENWRAMLDEPVSPRLRDSRGRLHDRLKSRVRNERCLTGNPARGLIPSMLHAEALRLVQILLGAGGVSPLLDLGSSTGRFRSVAQAHIQRDLFEPLRAAGVEVVHCDLKAEEGVDFVGDVTDAEVRRELRAKGFRCVLLANLLEHVRDRGAIIAACEEIVGPGGLILATVPSSCPYHADPIDTYYRPAPNELAKAFTRSETLIAEEVAGACYREDLRARGASVWKEAARTLLWGLIAFIRPRSFAARAHRWFWYSRPRRVAIALVRVVGSPEAPAL